MLDTHFSTIRPYCLVDKCGLTRTRLGNRKSVSVRWWLVIHAPESRSGRFRDFELHRSPGLPLNNHRTIADAAGGRYVSDRDRDQVATSKLAVDGEIEERQIPVSA